MLDSHFIGFRFRRTMRIFLKVCAAAAIAAGPIAAAQQSPLVSIGQNGRLQYHADARGNVVPDFSYVGYQHGERPIPSGPVVKTLAPLEGDNLGAIQGAITEVGGRTPDANGIRGVILLQPGTYNVSNSILLNRSGVILRGAGNSTRILATRRAQHSLITVGGSGGPSYNSSTRKKITDAYVPIGARTVAVEPGHTFVPGDRIILERRPNQAWIALLGMDKLSGTKWTPEDYTFLYKRVVKAVNGNVITIDAPVMDPIDPQYAEGFLYKYTWNNRVEHSGIESITLDSVYSSADDEEHAWQAVRFTNAENCWMQNVDCYHFGYAAADLSGSSYKISVINCRYLEPISKHEGGRKYSFNVAGQQGLVKNCSTHSGRHDFVLGARAPGPNAFVNCDAANQRDDAGPHQRWAVGCLFDNVSGNRELNVMNRLNSGTGHGWAGTQMMFWNCRFAKHTLQDPPADHINWAIGCTAPTITGIGRYTTQPRGYVESQGVHVLPQSLYEQQLVDRLDAAGVQPLLSVSVGPSSMASDAGATVTCVVTVTASGGFDGAVTPSVSGLPAGVAASFDPATLSGGGSTTMVLTVSRFATPGDYLFVVNASGGGFTAEAGVGLTVNEPQPVEDTGIGASDNAWVLRSATSAPQSVSQSLSMKRLNDSNTRIAYARFNLTSFFRYHKSVNVTSARLRLYVTSSVTAGGSLNVYGLKDTAGVPGSDAGWNSAMTWNTQPARTASPNDIPNSTAALPNANTTVRLGTAQVPSIAGELAVTLNVEDFINFLGSDTNDEVTLLFVTTGADIVSIASIANTSGHLPPTLEIHCPVSDFSLDTQPTSCAVTAGAGVVCDIGVAANHGFDDPVALEVEDLPPGVSAVLDPATVNGSGVSGLTLSTASDTPPGTYAVTVIGLSGILRREAVLTLAIAEGQEEDGEEIRESWMQKYFGHSGGQASDKSRPQDDADGDGVTNRDEFLADTDPTRADSYFRIKSANLDGPDVRVTWWAAGGKAYVVEAASRMDDSPAFADISPRIEVSGEGEIEAEFVEPGGATAISGRFYRVRLAP